MSLAGRFRGRVVRSLRRFHPDRGIAAAEFDAAFYLKANPDVAAAGVDPLEHFLARGWREGRDPNPQFSVRAYLVSHPEVAAADINPLVHYLRRGQAEAQAQPRDLGFRYEIIAGLIPLEQRIASSAKASASLRTSAESDLIEALAQSRSGRGDLHITFSHDDYTSNLGGVQLCLLREAVAVEKLGRDHLHVYPPRWWPVLRTEEAAALGLVWNGRPIGIYSPQTIAKALSATLPPAASGRSFAIHSLLGHSVDETLAILAAAGLKSGFFWLHDFASLCAGFHLLRNDVEDCAAPPPESPACGVCAYGPWRERHLAEHDRLFRKLDLTVVSPSEPTLKFWRKAWRFRAKGYVVLPHAALVERGRAPVTSDAPLRVGFPGMPTGHKGWPVFRQLALRFADDPRYEFHHFGAQQVLGLPAQFHPVSADGPQPGAMQREMEAAEIDVALIWPLCRETFSFTAYEAVAAGAAVLTNPDSGNVAAFVQAGGHGQVLADEAALTAAFETGDALALSRAVRRPRLHKLEFSALTMDLLSCEAA